MSQRIAHIWKLRWKNRTEQKAESAKSSLEAFDPEAVLDLAKTKKQKLRRSVKDLYIDLMEVKALSFIVDLWKYLRKSREEKKAELYESSLNAFDALAVLDSKTKQEIRCDVENLYNDLMEINVLQFKVNFIAIPLMVLFLIIAWFFVAGLIIVILGSLLSFLFSTSLNNIQSFLDTQSRNGNVWAAIVAGILYLGGFLLWLRVSFDITAFLLEPILSAYPRFFERLRNTRYPVASLVDKLIWLLHNAERYHTQERLKFDVRPYVTVVKWWQLNSQRKKDFLLVNGFATATDLAERQLNSQRKKDRITHIPYNLFIIATLHEKKCVCYSAGYITERNDKTNELRNIDRLGEPTTNIEKAYRAIETAVLERRVTIKALAPIMPKKPKEVEEKKEKPHNRVKNLIGYKQQQMLLLEGAARCLERYVPRQLRGGDAVTDYWLQETFQLAAAALREKKAWILTPIRSR